MNYWDNIYQTKDTSKVSWFQQKPETSLNIIKQLELNENDPVIDIGAGDGRLPDHLINLNFQSITVLDISGTALQKSRKRLKDKAVGINWVVSDILEYDKLNNYKLWHDRAVFHFLNNEDEQIIYKNNLLSNLEIGGYAIIATFSKNEGPEQCSGLTVCQHNENSIEHHFSPEFEMIDSFEEMHKTPSGSSQNFFWFVLKKV